MLTRFDTLLIANRGEIACRIMRTARAMGLRTVAVYTDADAGAPHVALADDAVLIGPGPVGDSYLNGARIISAAQTSGAGAIHPGYGFLSENAAFARAVAQAGLVFVGPSAEAIATMGDKAAAKRAMIAADVPCVPGYQGQDQSDATLIAQAAQIGYPVMVKASAGGGGRGMRLVAKAADLPQALALARAEAASAFGSDTLILERAITEARHVEIQIFADAHGACVHMGERDCSVQRRHQKLIEEAPCPVMTADLRAQMGAAAVRAAQSVGYCGAGTVEFLLDDAGQFYFLEMNTRLQVEHPVTEAVTGLDLVALQLQVAQGAALGLTQDDIRLKGHAIEARLYAEDPANGFLPATGTLTNWTAPSGPGVRVDAGVVTGQQISPHYDPMLAKVIAHGPTRAAARSALIAALERTALLGVPSNRGFLAQVLRQPEFAEGSATTGFLARAFGDAPAAPAPRSQDVAVAAALLLAADHAKAQAGRPDDGLFGLGAMPSQLDLALGGALHQISATPTPGARGWTLTADGWSHRVDLPTRQSSPARIAVDGRGATVHFAHTEDGVDFTTGAHDFAALRHRPWRAAEGAAGSGQIAAPMPGVVVTVDVAPGQRVEPGQRLAVLEAMKMQHPLLADIAGTIAQICATPGDQLGSGAVVIVIEEDPQ